MGFRFRKSIKAGPVRINLSKSGVGYSIGGKGFRYTKKANGGTRKTYSIPGTGISYVEETGTKKKSTNTRKGAYSTVPKTFESVANATSTNTHNDAPTGKTIYCSHCYRIVKEGTTICPACGKTISGNSADYSSSNNSNNKPKKPFYKRWWFIAIIIVALFNSCSGSDENNPPTEAISPTEIVITSEPTTDFSEITEPFTELDTEPSTEHPAEITRPANIIYDFSSVIPSNNGTTYVLNTSTKKFHYPSCSSADEIKASNKSSFNGTRSDVIAKGYSPCGRCDP